MAFNKQKESDFLILLLTTTLLVVPVISTTNIDCNGKAFHCVNSTHFKICVDFGGVSKTVDEFLIPCPPSTVCTDTNYFECEYQIPTTSASLSTRSDVTNEFTEESVSSTWELFEVTTFLPVNSDDKKIELLEDSPIYTSDMVSVLGAETSTTVIDTPVSDFLHKRITDGVNILNNTTIRDISESENLQTIDLIFNSTTTVTTTATTILTDNLRTSIAAETTEKYSITESEISEDLFNPVTATPLNTVKSAEVIPTKLITDTLSINSSPASVITQNHSDTDRNLTLGSFKPVITPPTNNTGNEDLIATTFFPVPTANNISTNSSPANVITQNYSDTDSEVSVGSFKSIITAPTNNNTGNEDLISTTIFIPVTDVNNLSKNSSPATVITAKYSDTDSQVTFGSYKAVTTTPIDNRGNEDLISTTLFSPVSTDNLGTNSLSAAVLTQNYSNTDTELSFGSYKPDITTPMNNKTNADFISTTLPSYVITDNSSIDSSYGAIITRNYTDPGSNVSFRSYKPVLTPLTNNTGNEDLILRTLLSPVRIDNNLSTNSSPAAVITQNNSNTASEISFGSYKPDITTPMNNKGNEDFITTTIYSVIADILTTDSSHGAVITRNYSDTGSNVSFGSSKLAITTSTNKTGDHQDLISKTSFSPVITKNLSTTRSPATVITPNFSDTDITTPMSNTGNEDVISTTISSVMTDNLSIDSSPGAAITRNYSDTGSNVSLVFNNSVITTYMNNTENEDLIATTLFVSVRNSSYVAQATEIYSSEISSDFYKPDTSAPTNIVNEDFPLTTLIASVKVDDFSPNNSLIETATSYEATVNNTIMNSFDPVTASLNNIQNVESIDLISSTLSSPMLKENPANNEIIMNGSSSDDFILAISSNSNIASAQEGATANPPTATITITNEFYKDDAVNSSKFSQYRSKDSSMQENSTYINNNTKILTNTSNSDLIDAGNNVTISTYDILNLYRTTRSYVSNTRQDTIPRHVPTTTAKVLYLTIPTSNNRENTELSLEFESATLPFPVINQNNPISEVIVQKPPSNVNLTTTTQSKNKQKDIKVMEINPNNMTNEFYSNVKSISNDKVEDFEIHGDAASSSPNVDVTPILSRYAHKLHPTTDANIYLTNTVEGFSTQELIYSQVTSDNYPIPENSNSILTETSKLTSTSDINFQPKNSYANVQFSTNIRNMNFPTASTATVNEFNTSVENHINEDTVKELLIHENDSYIGTIKDNITSINSDLISSTYAYTNELNFTTNITLNSAVQGLSTHENNTLYILVRNESSLISDNNEPSSHMTDSTITMNSYIANTQRNMEVSSINNLTIRTSTDNVLMERSSNTFNSSDITLSYNDTVYLSRQLSIDPSINVTIPIVTTVTPYYEQSTKTRTRDLPASKKITVSSTETAITKSESHEHNSIDSTIIISDYPINTSDTRKGNIEYNANFTNVNLSTNAIFQLKTLDDTDNKNFSIIRAKDIVNKGNTPTKFQTEINTESDYKSTTDSLVRNKMDNKLTKVLPNNENESISTTTIHFNFNPLYDNYNISLSENYNYKNNLSEPSILTSDNFKKPHIMNTPSVGNMFSIFVPEINNNSYSETKKINNTAIKKDIGNITIGKDELTVTTENLVSSINDLHSIVKDRNNITPSLEKDLNTFLPTNPILILNPIFLNTERTTPLNPTLMYNKNTYTTLKPITSHLSEDYFLSNGKNSSPRIVDKNTKLNITVPNVTNGDLQITNIYANKNSTSTNDIGAPILENNLRKGSIPMIELVGTATINKNISSEILLQNTNNKITTTYNGLNLPENIDKNVSLSNQDIQNSSSDTNEAPRTDNIIFLTAELNHFTKDITLYNQNETSQTSKINMEKKMFNVEQQNERENISQNNFDKTYLKSNIIQDSDTNSSKNNEDIFKFRERYKPEKSNNITPNAFIKKSSTFYTSTLKNQSIINRIHKIMDLTGVENSSNTNNQHEIVSTTNKIIFNKTQLNDKLQDSLSFSSLKTSNKSTLNIIKHLITLSAANLVNVTEIEQNNSRGTLLYKTRKYVNYLNTSNINTNKKDSVSSPVLTNEERRKEQITKITTDDLNKNIKNEVKVKSQFSCNSRHRGRYSDKYDCKKFYICIGIQEPIIGKCPDNTVFSKITKQCTKNLSHCIRNNQFQCTSAGRYIDIFSDQFYYICVKKVEGYIRFKLKCLKGYHLNKTKLNCMLDSLNGSMSNEDSSNTERDKSVLESKSKEDSKLKKEGKKEFKDFQCEKEGKFMYQDDCRKYYQCIKGRKSEFRRKIKKCDSDEVFNSDKRKCVDEESYECKD